MVEHAKHVPLIHRRSFLATGIAASAAVVAGGALFGTHAHAEGFEVPKLAYPYDALEPYIDAKTMEIHHDKHHAAYVANLNKALEGHEDLQKLSVEELLAQINKVPENIRTAVRNNGGGHMNHSMFWKIMKKGGGGEPS